MSSTPFIVKLDSQVPATPPVNWNMLNLEFARQVTQRLIWTQNDLKAAHKAGQLEPVRIDDRGYVHGPFTVFVPYPKHGETYLAAKVFYLNINDGKLVSTGSTPHQVAALNVPNKKGIISKAYLVGSALLPQFTPNDRIRPMQADKWQVWHKGELTHLAALLGFDRSAFSSSPKKNQKGDDAAPQGLGGLQKKFDFPLKFADEEEVVRSLKASKIRVERWVSSRQPVTKEAREYMRANGVRLTPSKKKQLNAEAKLEVDESDSAEGLASLSESPKKKSNKKSKKDKRDQSPVRKNSKTKIPNAPLKKKQNLGSGEADALAKQLEELRQNFARIQEQLAAAQTQ